ncbi:MAG: type II asparaginase [Sporomusaceae bacterium]|nr:type II asparaginase [Sporomusaceae bacterium]
MKHKEAALKKNIMILGTGGTIAGVAPLSAEPLHYTAAVLSVETVMSQVPEIKEVATIFTEQLAQVDSSNMNQEIWLKLARRINELLSSSEVDGIVVTHGTDTLEETAYFLNLVIKSLKPVVVVGAMRPVGTMSHDGPKNLYNAVVLASSQEAIGQGVLVCMNDTINSSRDVMKTNTTLQDSFKSPELGYLGYIYDQKVCFYRFPARKHTMQTEFDIIGLQRLPLVEILYTYVSCNPALATAAVHAGAEGLVIAGVGNGGIPNTMKESLIDIGKEGTVIVRSTRVSNGMVTRNDAINDDLYNFVVSDTLNPQKARVLLMLALTKTTDPAEIQRMFWIY